MSDPSLLSLKNLSVDLVRADKRQRILDGIDLEIPRNRVLGILGESGSGKTTLAKAMIGWVPPPLVVSAGGITYESRDLLDPAVARMARARIGFIGADPGSAFDPTLPVGVQIAEKLRAVRPQTTQEEAQRRTIALLDAVRIPSAAKRYREFPNQYSGGMLQRALIVDAMVTEPDLLICDNIIQPLDVTVAAQIVRLLRELRERMSTGIVFISTSVPSIAEVADDAVVLAAGRIVERGDPMSLARHPRHAVTRELVARTPRIWTGEAVPEPAARQEQPILQVDDVTKTYRVKDRGKVFGRQSVQAVRGVSFEVFRGDNFGLVGESGCGKSTLSRLLSWVEEPDAGSIRFEGRDIATMTGRERLAMRRGFQLLLQDPYNCLPPHMPVGKTIGVGLAIHGVGRKEIATRVRDVMAEVGLSPDDINRLPVGMSAGQRQRVNIARALVLEPRLVILDETLSSLDPVEQGRLLALFERLQARHGLTYLFISHDLAMVRRVCTRIAVMYLGKMVEVADTGGVFYDPGHPYTKALLSAVPTLDERPYRTQDVLLDGEPPNPIDLPPGCSFAGRCPEAHQPVPVHGAAALDPDAGPPRGLPRDGSRLVRKEAYPVLIDPDRLHALMDAFLAHGGEPGGGMHRLTLSAQDGAARDHLKRWMRDQGLRVTVDPMGNMFGLMDLAGPDAPVVMTGSHLDSQPHGGRFDGAYGVLAACEAAQTVRERASAEGVTPRCNLAIVNWTNEEGARFQPSLLGSAVYAGLMDLSDALARRDGDGVGVAEALSGIGYAGTGRFPPPQAYIELHVECAAVLEQARARFGAICRHWGAVKYRLAFVGRQAHTGPTPMAERQDALLGAARLIAAIGALPGGATGTLHTSVGRLEVRPNSPNVVPGEAVLFLELRSPEQAVLDWAEREMLAAAASAATAARVRFEVRAIDRRPVGFFDEGLVVLAGAEAAHLGLPMLRLDTIAAHDAICMIPVCPSVVLNVPSVGGVCHHPSELTSKADLELGADLLARMLWRLCRDGLSVLNAASAA